MTVRHALAAAVLALAADGVAADLPPTPAPIDQLMVARGFEIEEPFHFPWDATQPPATRGWILVFAVDPALCEARQVAMPLLHVGHRMAFPTVSTVSSGWVVALVLGPADLATDPIWYGTPRLPEQLRPAHLASERALAAGAGIVPVPPDELRRARVAGGDVVRARDMAALAAKVEDLRRRYLPTASESSP